MTSKPRALTVIKLGGSVIFSQNLSGWIEALINIDQPIVLVTGGGHFADLVRDTQIELTLDDPTAHKMALLAMDQTALLVANHHQRFVVANSKDKIADAIQQNQIPIWSPNSMTNDHEELEQNWRTTSDTLALWLAHQLSASQIYLIKSVELQEPQHNAHQLATEDIVDEAFPETFEKVNIPASLLGPADCETFPLTLNDNKLAGKPITLASNLSSTNLSTTQ